MSSSMFTKFQPKVNCINLWHLSGKGRNSPFLSSTSGVWVLTAGRVTVNHYVHCIDSTLWFKIGLSVQIRIHTWVNQYRGKHESISTPGHSSRFLCLPWARACLELFPRAGLLSHGHFSVTEVFSLLFFSIS